MKKNKEKDIRENVKETLDRKEPGGITGYICGDGTIIENALRQLYKDGLKDDDPNFLEKLLDKVEEIKPGGILHSNLNIEKKTLDLGCPIGEVFNYFGVDFDDTISKHKEFGKELKGHWKYEDQGCTQKQPTITSVTLDPDSYKAFVESNIKPLEWEDFGEEIQRSYGVGKGHYRIWRYVEFAMDHTVFEVVYNEYPSIEAAKAAANEHHKEQVLKYFEF